MKLNMEIPEIKIVLNPETDEAKRAIGFKWAGEDSEGRIVGCRHKIGGKPYWLQSDESPDCECGKEMTFYGQFDSIGDELCLADCGMIYVFVSTALQRKVSFSHIERQKNS